MALVPMMRLIYEGCQNVQNVPTRVTLRIISGSIFLMKSLGIGIGATKMHASLDLLQKAISALGSNAVNELQLCHRYPPTVLAFMTLGFCAMSPSSLMALII
jgi:hypothetical protein